MPVGFAILLLSDGVPVSSSDPMPVAAASLPLPTGASTAARQDTGNSSLASIDTKLSGTATASLQGTGNTSLGNIDTKTPALVSGRVPVDGSAVTQPVSASSLPLPSGAATSAKQDTEIASLASIDAKLTNAATTTLQGALTETAPASDTASSGLNGRLQRIAQRLTSLIALLPASLGIKTAANSLSVAPASDATFALTSGGYQSQPTVTRPANTTAYSIGDVVGGVITFVSAGPSGGHVLINTASLLMALSAVPSGMSSFRLYFYSSTPPSAIADNAAWTSTSDRDVLLAFIDISLPALLGGTPFVQNNTVGLQLKLGAGETSLYGYLVTNGAYTPAAPSEVYTLTLNTVAL